MDCSETYCRTRAGNLCAILFWSSSFCIFYFGPIHSSTMWQEYAKGQQFRPIRLDVHSVEYLLRLQIGCNDVILMLVNLTSNDI